MVFAIRQTFKSFYYFAFNFRVFDRDGNGFITRDELRIAMEMIGENVTEKQVSDMLAIADLDKDGKINYEGLTHLMILLF